MRVLDQADQASPVSLGARASDGAFKVTAFLPTAFGTFSMVAYDVCVVGECPVALVYGASVLGDSALVRIHSACLTGDVFGSDRCDCGPQLKLALRMIADAGHGALIYLRHHEGRGIGLFNKLRAYLLQDAGQDTVDANLSLGLPSDARTYEVAALILRDLGAQRVRLLTNSPQKVAALTALGVAIAERIPLELPPTADNRRYLETKKRRFGHHLQLVGPPSPTPPASECSKALATKKSE